MLRLAEYERRCAELDAAETTLRWLDSAIIELNDRPVRGRFVEIVDTLEDVRSELVESIEELQEYLDKEDGP